jgi:hypothetical protein
MNQYEVLTPGGYQDAKGINHPKGSKVVSARNLVADFGDNVFKDLGEAPLTTQVKPAKAPVAPQPELKPDGDKPAAEDEKPALGQGQEEQPANTEEDPLEHPDSTGRKTLGEDVTAKYPLASENEFKVFKGTGGWHYVTEPESPMKALNPKALKADKVDEFVKTLLK